MGDFFKTMMGRKFFEGHVPRLIKSLEKIGNELERQNNLLEKQIEVREEGEKQNETN